jgi:tRNA nucleotidyltransferase/poly(A) polymerase
MQSTENAFRWTKEPRLARITAALRAGGTARFVGGCVRDSLLGQDPLTSDAIDIDIACDRSPDEMKALFDAAGIRWVATGEEHGTLTAIEDGMVAECTSLRADEVTDGRHAEVRFTLDWDEDWRRRDFTINALYLDAEGELWDPAGGLPDLEAGRVRFIGDPGERIREDALRILRFFRFSARFSETFDQDGLEAIARHTQLLGILSKERIWSELSRTFAARRSPAAFEAAEAAGALGMLMPPPCDLESFGAVHARSSEMTPALGAASLWPRRRRDELRSAFKPSAAFLDEYEVITAARKAARKGCPAAELLYRFGREGAAGGLRLAVADGKVDPAELDEVRRQNIPVLPFGGKDLIALGHAPGPELGRTLKRFEALWIEAGLPRDETVCRALLDQAAEEA